MKDLKTVYKANNEKEAKKNLDEMIKRWKKYSLALSGWGNNWEELQGCFEAQLSFDRE